MSKSVVSFSSGGYLYATAHIMKNGIGMIKRMIDEHGQIAKIEEIIFVEWIEAIIKFDDDRIYGK